LALKNSREYKVAERSFRVPVPDSPLLLDCLRFGARFWQESRLTIEEFILAFGLGCVLLRWRWGWLEAGLTKWFLFVLKNSTRYNFKKFCQKIV